MIGNSQGLNIEAQDWREDITYLLVMDPWSKGDYSRSIPEVIMVMEEPPAVNPPSGRVPGQELQAIPRSESRRRRNNRRNHVTELSLRVSGSRDKYRPKGGVGGGPPSPGTQRARPPPRARCGVAWMGGGPTPAPLRASGVVRHI